MKLDVAQVLYHWFNLVSSTQFIKYDIFVASFKIITKNCRQDNMRHTKLKHAFWLLTWIVYHWKFVLIMVNCAFNLGSSYIYLPFIQLYIYLPFIIRIIIWWFICHCLKYSLIRPYLFTEIFAKLFYRVVFLAQSYESYTT